MIKNNDLSLIEKHRNKIFGIAALWIYFFHLWTPIIEQNTYIEFIKRIGFCGVDIFLLLSGIGLTHSIKKHNLKQFYYNRIKRIIFPFIIAALIFLIYGKWSIFMFLKNILFYDFFFNDIYTFLWYVPCILIFYLLFPLYYKYFEKSKNKYLFIFISLLIWALPTFLLIKYIRPDFYGIIHRIPIFITGIFFGWFIKEKNFQLKKTSLVFTTLILLLSLQISYMINIKNFISFIPSANCLPNYFIALTLTILLAFLFEKTKKLKISKYTNYLFIYYGTISLHFYCIQETIGKIIKLDNTPIILRNIILLIIITITSKILYFLDIKFWQLLKQTSIKKKKESKA